LTWFKIEFGLLIFIFSLWKFHLGGLYLASMDTKAKQPEIPDDIYEMFQVLTKRIDARFDLVDKRFEHIDEQFKNIDRQFNDIRGQLGQIPFSISNHERRISNLEG